MEMILRILKIGRGKELNTMKILVVNAGSSSHKLSLYDLQDEEPIEPLWKGLLDWGREGQPLFLSIKNSKGVQIERNLEHNKIEEGIKTLLDSLWQGNTQVIESSAAIERVGHRVVHGGSEFEQPTRIDAGVKERIRQLIPLAPLHNRANLQGIELMEKFFPSILQIAVFDTAFHVTMPEIVKTYPLPWEWKEKGIQRYGFHGISHHYCAERATKFLKQDAQSLKIINCHLGNGCSLCAIQEGKSFETTMGLTPLEGLMMGTRCGSIDPGILLYLMREHQMSSQALDEALNFESGLKGIGGSSDMRDLLSKQEERARLAVHMFIHRLKTAIGALAVSLGGFNVLSFTGGIGENAASIREETCRGLACLNVAIDFEKNRVYQPDAEIAMPSSPIRVLVLHTREEWMIARSCFSF
jgi:acetate kinase